MAAGQPALLVIRVRNSLPQALTNISTTDHLPAGMVVATPANASTTCAGAVATADVPPHCRDGRRAGAPDRLGVPLRRDAAG